MRAQNELGRLLPLLMAFAGLTGASCSQPCVGDACSQSAGSIAGTLSLSDGASPLAIEVSLLGTERRALTSADGHFSLSLVDPGSYMLRATAAGYEALVLNATVMTGATAQVTGTLLRTIANDAGSDGGRETDAGMMDADAGIDAGMMDADAGIDAGMMDADAGIDAGMMDADAGIDAGMMDADAGIDAGPVGMDALNGHAFLFGSSDHRGIQVSVTGGPTAASFFTTTSEDGTWSLGGLIDGVYTVSFTAPLFESHSVANVVTAPGTVTLDDVTLERSAQIDSRVLTSAAFLADGLKVLLNVKENGVAKSALYDVTSHTVTDLISLPSTLRGQSADGQYATLSLADGSLRRWATATGFLDIISPAPKSIAFSSGDATVYLDAQGNVMLVRADQQAAMRLLTTPCTGGTLLSVSGVEDSVAAVNVRCSFFGGYSAYVAPGPGRSTGWIKEVMRADDGQHFVVSEYPGTPPSGTDLIRQYSLPDFQPVTIGHGMVGSRFSTFDACRINSDECPLLGYHFFHDDGVDGQSLSIVQAADGAVEPIATQLKPASGESVRGVVVAKQGPNEDRVVVDLLRRQTVLLCSGPGQSLASSSFFSGAGESGFDPVVVCREGTAIKAFHSVSGQVQTIEIGDATQWFLQGRMLHWQDDFSSYAMLMNDTTPVDLGYDSNFGAYNTLSPSGESLIRSSGDSVPRWVNLKTHETRTFLTGDFLGTSQTCEIHKSDRTAVCRFAVSSGTAPCGSRVCVSMLGPDGTSATVGAATGGSLSWLLWNEAGTAFAGGTLLTTAGGSPALTLLPSVEMGKAIGSNGAFAITRLDASPFTYFQRDLVGGTSTAIPSTSSLGSDFLAFNHASELAAGDVVYHLDDNTVVPLGSGLTLRRVADDGSVLTFLQGPSGAQTLGTYSAANGVRTLAENAILFSDALGSSRWDLFWTDAGSSVGTLGWQDFVQGQFHPLATSVSRQITAGRWDDENFVTTNSDVTGSVGDLAVLNSFDKTILPLGVRTSAPPAPQLGTKRFTIAGVDAQGVPGFYVGELSGAGSKRLADSGEDAMFLADETRVTFTAEHIWYVEGRDAAPSIPLARWAEAPGSAVLSPDGTRIIFGLGGATPTAAMRHGVFTAKLE